MRPDRTVEVVLGLLLAAVLVLAGIVIVAHSVRHSTTARAGGLPKAVADALAAEGERVTVETGTTPDHRAYSIQVSRSGRHNGYCSFLTIEPPAGGGSTGGGGCGPGRPLSYSVGDDGVLHGLADVRIMTVEVVTPHGRRTISTKPLPAQFEDLRYFVVMLPGRTAFSELIGRGRDGAVIARQKAFR
jgi:hypothetical protein